MKVEFRHYRVMDRKKLPRKGAPSSNFLRRYGKGSGFYGEFISPAPAPFARGGKTVCIITLDDGAKFRGTALCSMSDAFSYTIGRAISHGRAVKAVFDNGL